jgi:hypothetical protein
VQIDRRGWVNAAARSTVTATYRKITCTSISLAPFGTAWGVRAAPASAPSQRAVASLGGSTLSASNAPAATGAASREKHRATRGASIEYADTAVNVASIDYFCAHGVADGVACALLASYRTTNTAAAAIVRQSSTVELMTRWPSSCPRSPCWLDNLMYLVDVCVVLVQYQYRLSLRTGGAFVVPRIRSRQDLAHVKFKSFSSGYAPN